MEIAPLVTALETLQAQHEAVVAEEQQIQSELDLVRTVRANLETAMRSIETLVTDSSTWESIPSTRSLPKVTVRATRADEFLNRAVEDARSKDVPPELVPYVPAVGGKRLKSKRMIFDLLQKYPEPVTRDQLQHLFFYHFGRENLERYWARPANALNTAIDRAADDGIIEKDVDEHGSVYYTAGWANAGNGAPAFGDDEDQGEDD